MVNWLSPILLLLHPFNGLFSRTTWASRYQKGKTSLDWNEARDDGVLGCSGMSWTICKQSAPRSRQITSPTPHSSRPEHWQKTTSKVSWLQSYSGSKWIVRRYRPGESETICPPPMAVRRWHVVSPPIKNRGGSMSACRWVRSPFATVRSLHISGGQRWLSCRQPACLQPRQLPHGTDRRTDRAIPKCPL